MTIYSNGKIFIQEVRSLELKDGRIKIGNIPSGLIPTSVNFKSLTETSAKVVEQT